MISRPRLIGRCLGDLYGFWLAPKDAKTSNVGLKYSDDQLNKRKHGAVRDAIVETLTYRAGGATIADITREVSARIGETPASSIRSYLRLNTPRLFTKVDRGYCRVREEAQTTLGLPEQNGYGTSKPITPRDAFRFGNATLIHADCFEWLGKAASNSIEAVVTDPPYGLFEYSPEEQEKLRSGRGASGGFRPRLTATNARRCRALRY